MVSLKIFRISLALAAFAFLSSFRIPESEIPDFSGHGERVDSFIVRTIDRINESWTMCGLEFRLAADSGVILERDAGSRISDAASEAVDNAVERVKDGVVNEINNKKSD